jgi:hypothetical protein
MVPVFGENNGCPELFASIVADMRRLCPEIAKVMGAPLHLSYRETYGE